MRTSQDTTYDIKELVNQLGGRPGVETEAKLTRFLHMTGVLNKMEPNPLLKRRRFVWVEKTIVRRGNRSKTVNKVYFSEYGREWLEILAALYYNTVVDNGQRFEMADDQ